MWHAIHFQDCAMEFAESLILRDDVLEWSHGFSIAGCVVCCGDAVILWCRHFWTIWQFQKETIMFSVMQCLDIVIFWWWGHESSKVHRMEGWHFVEMRLWWDEVIWPDAFPAVSMQTDHGSAECDAFSSEIESGSGCVNGYMKGTSLVFHMISRFVEPVLL